MNDARDTRTQRPHAGDATHFDVAVIGAGSAAASLVGSLDGALGVVVFEPRRVGGICPFDACVPSKAMLHDARAGFGWDEAIERRDALTHHGDDEAHADELADRGATLVRRRATLVDAGTVEADGRRFTADHIVLATGAQPTVPDIVGIDDVRDLVWTSDDAMNSSALPDRLIVVGGGVIGCEMAHMFARFGSAVVVVDDDERPFPELTREVSAEVGVGLESCVDELLLGRRPAAVRRHGDRIAVTLDDGDERRADRLLVAVGRRPSLHDLGLQRIGLDPDAPLPVGPTGRVGCPGSVWAIGDVAGGAQYTHAAGHHGSVVADQLAGTGRRRFDDVVTASCMFTDPPMFTVGPTHRATLGDDDIVWSSADLDGVVRANTDGVSGALAVAASRTTRRLVAAHGVGPRFDELVHALVIAIDGAVPIDRLVQSMYPFPTFGNALGQRLLDVCDRL